MFTFNGREFASRTACSVQLVNDGMTVSEAAKNTGLEYITVYVSTVGKKHRLKQIAKRRAKKLKSSKKNYSIAEISRRSGLNYTAIKKLFTTVQ